MSYIDAAFRSSHLNEAYLFMQNQYVLLNYAPDTIGDKVLVGPLLISVGYPFLRGTTFVEHGIDCAFGSHHKDQAFIFSGNLCAQIHYTSYPANNKIIKGPMTIAAMFPFFTKMVFESGVDAAFESTKKYEAYLFKGNQCAHINYDYDSHLIAIYFINQRFPSLNNTIFESGIDAAFASHKTDEAYLFRGDYCARINFAPGKDDDISGDIKKILTYWPFLRSILPLKTSCAPEHVIWIKSVKKKLRVIKENPSTYFSIYKVPTKLRQLREHTYTPSTVSIGPFHHGRSDLHAMEEHKWRYMLSFLQRTPDGKPTLKKCAEALQVLEQDARRHYADNIGPFHHSRNDLLAMDQKNWRSMLNLLHQALNPRKNSDECAISESEENTGKHYADQHTNCHKEAEASFLEILLVDGCFILELLLRRCDKNFKDEDDPITSNAWMVPAILRDLALLENQIPFVVLQKLFDIVRSTCTPTDPLASACSCSLPELAMLFFQPLLNTDKDPSISKELCHDDRHFLGMLHKFYLPNNPVSPTNRPEDKKAWGFRHCATELSEAGIEFEKGTQGGLLDITTSKGVVVIPPFSIDETLDLLLRNLIAFEQCSFRTTHHISSYVFLMSGLIKSSNDIEFLQSKGIITTIPGKAEDASTFFSRMYNGVVLREFYFTGLCEEVNASTKSWWHYHRIKALLLLKCRRYLSELIRDHFSNPWRVASTFAAVVLLVLTLLQTIYTMRA